METFNKYAKNNQFKYYIFVHFKCGKMLIILLYYYIIIMNIIIPLGGKGERFKINGFTSPKPLIKIFDK